MIARALLCLLAAVTGVQALTAGTADAAIERPFAARFSANDTGDIAVTGNTLMTCPASDAGCASAQAGTSTGAALNNNGYGMQRVDVDGDPSTIDSSSATLALPPGATVLFAGLYYGARTTGGMAAPAAAARSTVRLRAPDGAGYRTLSAAVTDSAVVTAAYVGFADVTTVVAAAGSGPYTVADVQSGTGLDRYAGWSLVVAYRDPAQPPRNLTVADGLAAIQQGDPPLSVTIGGFVTPRSGPVRSRVGLVAYEGDRGSAGDRASLGAQPLVDGANPVNNVFNSSIAAFGAAAGGRDPGYVNQLGFDADLLDASGALANGATSATLSESTTLDQYLTQVVTLSTDLLVPRLELGKGVEDLTHPDGAAAPGDVLRYTITVTDSGQDGATDVVVGDALPAGTAYVPRSLRIGGAAVSDAVGDDAGEFDAAANRVVARPGALAPGAAATLSFEARIRGDVASGTVIANRAGASGRGETVPVPVSASSAATQTLVVARAPLETTSTLTPAHPTTRDRLVQKIVVHNPGSEPEDGATLTDTLHGPLDVASVVASQGSCHVARDVVRCTLGSLAPGASATVSVRLRPTGPGTIAAMTVVRAPGAAAVRSKVRRTVVEALARLVLRKRADVARARPGQVVGYRISLRVRGRTAARRVRVCDSLPDGLRLQRAAGASRRHGRACWTLERVGAGRTRTLHVVARVVAARRTKLVNRATARAANARGRQRAAATVRVRPLSNRPCPAHASALAHAAC